MIISYILIFIGVLIGGEMVWFPALYLSYTGALSFWCVFFYGLLAAFVMDIGWYLVGRYVAGRRVSRLPFIRKNIDLTKKIHNFFHWGKIPLIIGSKFFYGTRVIIVLLCGMHKTRMSLYLPLILLANMIWGLFTLILITVIGGSLQTIEHVAGGVQIGVVVFVVVAIALNYGMQRIVKKIKNRKVNGEVDVCKEEHTPTDSSDL